MGKGLDIERQELVNEIERRVLEKAESARKSAAWSGHHDGFANDMKSNLTYWLDGIKFATTGETKAYNVIIDEIERDNDPEYQNYLRLKAKFGDK